MKDTKNLFLVLLIVASLILGCTNPSAGDGSGSTVLSAGDTQSFTVATDLTMNMKYCPAKTLFTGTDDSGSATVSKAFWIGETEVDYWVWYTIYTWAVNNGYSFGNTGREGDNGTKGASPANAKTASEPVTYINWRDCMIFCNALTEYYNAQKGTSYKCVYYTDESYSTPLRTSTTSSTYTASTTGSQDCPYIYAASSGNTDMANCTATGFRLPTSNEWELAARYIKDSNSDGDICDSGEYYPGSYASGADADYQTTATSDYDGDGDIQSTADVAVYSGNAGSATATVKSKSANALGCYDMSGNTYEWCFDWYSTSSSSPTRVIMGGCWIYSENSLRVGYVNGETPNYGIYNFGVRLCRTAE